MMERPASPNAPLWLRLALKAAANPFDIAYRFGGVREGLAGMLGAMAGLAMHRNSADPEMLKEVRWFGSHLDAFFRRVARERPAAARALIRFVSTYTLDLYRRNLARRQGLAGLATVVIEPTNRCNLKCPGCYADSGQAGTDLPFEAMVQAVEQAVAMGASLITLSGGEPFLRERIDRGVTRLGGLFPNHGFLVYTNGTLVDEAVATRLGRLGNVFPAISVEGFASETDSRRGRGIFEQNSRVRRLLARAGVMTGFSATVTSQNADSLASDAFIDYRIAEGDMFGWFFLLQPIGRSPRPELMVTARQRSMLRASVRRWRESSRPIFLGDFWNDGPLAGGCLAGGRYYFHIRANGDVSPCVFAPLVCGNLLDILNGTSEYASLAELVRRHPVFIAFRQEQTRIDDRQRPCLLIDHPAAIRRIAAAPGCRTAANMPPGYLDGAIAGVLDACAAEFRNEMAAAVIPEEREYE